MNDFLTSLKADLLDRRLLPLVAVVAVGLIAAVAYAAVGGSSSTATPTASTPSASASTPAGLATSQETSETAVAEVTSGAAVQHHGSARNPFNPLPGATAKAASTSSSSSSSTKTSSSTSSSSSSSESGSSSKGSSGGSAPTTPSKPSTPEKPKTVYHVAVLFGALPVSASSPLTPYENLKLLTPLPSGSQALIVFRGVTAGGKSATFTLVGEAILHGEGSCLPSATQCEAIDLRAGKAEQLEYLSSTGQVQSYELKVVSIASEQATGAAVKYALRGESKAGRELLSHDGLMAIPYLRYSADAGVLVFAGHGAFAARARASAHRSHRR